jgi:hypothetical protein
MEHHNFYEISKKYMLYIINLCTNRNKSMWLSGMKLKVQIDDDWFNLNPLPHFHRDLYSLIFILLFT